MSGAAQFSLQQKFSLDSGVLAAGSAATLELGSGSEPEVAAAIVRGERFPDGANGAVDLAHINLVASGDSVSFQGAGATASIGFKAGVTAGAGVYTKAADAIAALGLGESPGLDLTVAGGPDVRYLLLRSGYTASGSLSGAHPIGALGKLTFGVTRAAAGLTAVLRRFPTQAPAREVLLDAVKNWRLPGQVREAAAIAPETWVIAEATGSLAVKLAASLGYNFDFVRKAKQFGLSGDIGLKVDAAATATFGFEAAGRYLVVVGREAADEASQRLRLRLFKLLSGGVQCGLNLKVGVTGVDTLTPDSAAGLVKAVFGVHGAQLTSALGRIGEWAGSGKNVGELVAGLTNDYALALMQKVTGVDPRSEFEAARGKLTGAIKLYQGLPARVSSELLGILGLLDETAAAAFREALILLGSSDEARQKKAFTEALGTVGIAKTPVARLLDAAAEGGLLRLLNRLPEVRSVAGTVLSILDGGVIAKLQAELDKAFDLNKAIQAVQKTDFDALDKWLVGRLSAFFGKERLQFEDLAEVTQAIHMVSATAKTVYTQARTALDSRYGFEAAAAWQSTTSSTALVDAEFDMGDATARQLFQETMEGTGTALDRLLTNTPSGVRLNAGVLSHELTRKATVNVSLPRIGYQSGSVTKALARVKAGEDQGRILLYDASGSNTDTVRNKFRSGVTMTLAALVGHDGVAGHRDLRVHSDQGTAWSYQLLYAKPNVKRQELEAVTRPFVTGYNLERFIPGSLDEWYNRLEEGAGGGALGDTCAAFEVAMPGELLAAWAKPVDRVTDAKQTVSLAIQGALRQYLPWFYLQEPARLKNLASTAPLLAWWSIPPAVEFDGTAFGTSGGRGVFWDYRDPALRRAAATHAATAAGLRRRLPDVRARLEAAGMQGTLPFYQDGETAKILKAATGNPGDGLLEKLLRFDSRIVEKAGDAFAEMQRFVAAAGNSPTEAVERLAEFAADITEAFGTLTGESVFANLASFRAIAQMVFAEASRALAGAQAAKPSAMLTLSILNADPARRFQLASFVTGAQPAAEEIAFAQRLVSAPAE